MEKTVMMRLKDYDELKDKIDYYRKKIKEMEEDRIKELKEIFKLRESINDIDIKMEKFEKELEIIQMENILANEKEYHKWQKEIPNISFPSDWEIRIIPPFGGAIVRFLVIKGDRKVSVYLDCYDRLGIYGEPYWEMYPNKSGDVDRLSMNDVEGLLQSIKESLEYKEE